MVGLLGTIHHVRSEAMEADRVAQLQSVVDFAYSFAAGESDHRKHARIPDRGMRAVMEGVAVAAEVEVMSRGGIRLRCS
jgi:hypothetical protein